MEEDLRQPLLIPSTSPTPPNTTTTTSSIKKSTLQILKTKPFLPLLITTGILALANAPIYTKVPSLLTTIYAREIHSSSAATTSSLLDNFKCGVSNIDMSISSSCFYGNNKAQDFISYSDMIKNVLAFLFAPFVGSYTDCYGRKKGLIAAALLQSLPLLFVFCMVYKSDAELPAMTKADNSSSGTDDTNLLFYATKLYYITTALQGIVSPLSIVMSAASDILPMETRAVGYGLILALFLTGFSLAPFFSLACSDERVTTLLCFLIAGFVPFYIYFFVTETVTHENKIKARIDADLKKESVTLLRSNMSFMKKTISHLTTPFTSLKTLFTTKLTLTLSLCIIFNSMASEAAETLLFFYVSAGPFFFTEVDLGGVVLVIGVLGVITQSFLLNPLIKRTGERRTVVIAAIFGALHMLFYAFAKTRMFIYIGASLVSISLFAYPSLSAIVTFSSPPHLLGTVQVNLYALRSLSGAFGPIALRMVNNITKDDDDDDGFKGWMWIFGAFFYFFMGGLAFCMPDEETNSNAVNRNAQLEQRASDIKYGSSDEGEEREAEVETETETETETDFED